MSIPASMVKDLREKTGAGMMDCKKALDENNGNMDSAIDWLRQKGLSKAAKKSGRSTSEGLIGYGVSKDGRSATLVEVKCETDFVSRDEKFQSLVTTIVEHAAETTDVTAETILTQTIKNTNRTIQELLNDAIATIGENIIIGRCIKMKLTESAQGIIGHYIHSNGKIAVLVEIHTDKPEEPGALQELAKNIAMQIAATTPIAIAAENINPADVEREKEIYRQKAREEGKPENIIEKIAEGAVKKFFKEVCLLEQSYIRNDKISIADLLKEESKKLGNLSIVNFARLQLGS